MVCHALLPRYVFYVMVCHALLPRYVFYVMVCHALLPRYLFYVMVNYPILVWKDPHKNYAKTSSENVYLCKVEVWSLHLSMDAYLKWRWFRRSGTNGNDLWHIYQLQQPKMSFLGINIHYDHPYCNKLPPYWMSSVMTDFRPKEEYQTLALNSFPFCLIC